MHTLKENVNLNGSKIVRIVFGHITTDQRHSSTAVRDASVYEQSSQKQSGPSAAINVPKTSSDSLTHFLKEPIWTLACFIFNPQDGFAAFVCVTGSSDLIYGLYNYKSCFCLAAGFLGEEGFEGEPQIRTYFAFGLVHFREKSMKQGLGPIIALAS